MATNDSTIAQSTPVALPGLGRALIAAGKLDQTAAENLVRKTLTSRNSFIAELVGSGAVSPTDLAHVVSGAFGAPLLISMRLMHLGYPRTFSTINFAASIESSF